MNQDRLRLDLADLADEVTPVDLRDRALRTSRRLGIQRAVVTSAAALLVLAAATGTALAIRPDGQAPAPAVPSVTSTPPPPQVTPTPTVTPSRTPSAGPSTTTGGGPAGATFGRLFYGPSPTGDDTSTAGHLWSFQPGSQPTRLAKLPRLAAILNAVVSPDGSRVAWVDPDENLWVADVDGGNPRKLTPGGHRQVEQDCWTPVWSPDARRLAISVLLPTAPALTWEKGVVELTTGKYTPISEIQGCHPVWSADGKVLAYADGEGRVAVNRPDGTAEKLIPGLGVPGARSSFDVASISPDGSRLALLLRKPDEPAGDVARELDANAVIDTRTGRQVQLPLGGRPLLQAAFRDDGTLVARVGAGDHNVLVLIGADGRKISESREPATLKGQQILQVVG
ncbi:TolB family protein [Micromonospora sp. NPDC049282]|uniref:TolB family protein n=1 Tax=Micromonospora sp. NPDC049282 TaxID=3364269 RepID=UPI003721EECB